MTRRNSEISHEGSQVCLPPPRLSESVCICVHPWPLLRIGELRCGMQEYRLIAIDLDGTLLNHEGKVSEANKAAVRRALEAGFRVVFATGRNYYESLPVID